MSVLALAQQNTSTTSGIGKELSLINTPVASTDRASEVETSVRAYFSDIPALIEIARCESGFRHTDKSGNILRGTQTTDDIGVMQINEYYHGESAKRLGYDITSLNGNMAFARHLYGVYGTDPWKASAKCWKKPTPGLLAERK